LPGIWIWPPVQVKKDNHLLNPPVFGGALLYSFEKTEYRIRVFTADNQFVKARQNSSKEYRDFWRTVQHGLAIKASHLA
jgi:hypothetical protein